MSSITRNIGRTLDVLLARRDDDVKVVYPAYKADAPVEALV